MFDSLFLAPSQSKALPNQEKAKQCRNQSIALDDQLTLEERVFRHLEATAGKDQASAYAQKLLEPKGLGKKTALIQARMAPRPMSGRTPDQARKKKTSLQVLAPISQRGYEACVDEKGGNEVPSSKCI